MHKGFTLSFLLLMATAAQGGGPLDTGRQRVAELGRLNGIALACRYFDQTRRIKRLLIDNLPKSRELGQLFDDRTNESFLRFVNSGKSCPSPASFGNEVSQAAGRLRAAFAEGAGR